MLHTLLLPQPQRVSTVRVKTPPTVMNERRTRRRISDEEMDIGEAFTSDRQDELGVEDVRQVPEDHRQDKQDPGGA